MASGVLAGPRTLFPQMTAAAEEALRREMDSHVPPASPRQDEVSAVRGALPSGGPGRFTECRRHVLTVEGILHCFLPILYIECIRRVRP